MEKPALCLVNKMDTDGAEEKLEEIMELLGKGYDEAVSEMDEDSRPRRRDAIQLRFWTCVSRAYLLSSSTTNSKLENNPLLNRLPGLPSTKSSPCLPNSAGRRYWQ